MPGSSSKLRRSRGQLTAFVNLGLASLRRKQVVVQLARWAMRRRGFRLCRNVGVASSGLITGWLRLSLSTAGRRRDETVTARSGLRLVRGQARLKGWRAAMPGCAADKCSAGDEQKPMAAADFRFGADAIEAAHARAGRDTAECAS